MAAANVPECTAMSVTEDDLYNNDGDGKRVLPLAMDESSSSSSTVGISNTPQKHNRLNIRVSYDNEGRVPVHSSPPTKGTRRPHPEKTMLDTPVSTCSTATNTTATTMSTSMSTNTHISAKYLYNNDSEGECQVDCESSTSSSSRRSASLIPSTPTIRGVPLPSPSRARLDRNYAKRLAASNVVFQHVPVAKSAGRGAMAESPNNTIASSYSPLPSPSSRTILTHRDAARNFDGDSNMIFRPKSILTTRDKLPGRFLFPPSPRRESRLPKNSPFVSNSNISSPRRISNNNTTISNNTSNTSTTTLSSSRRRMSGSFAFNSMDVGISDRFIPSRATSNMNRANLWDSMNSSSSKSNGAYYYGSSSQPSSASSPSRPRSDSDAGTRGDGGANATHANAGAGGGTGADDPSNNAAGGGSVSVNPATGRVNETSSITTQQNLHNELLRSELLGENISPYSYNAGNGSGNNSSRSNSNTPPRDGISRFRFQSPRQAYRDTIYDGALRPTSVVNSFSLTPFGNPSSQQLMSAPQKHRRKIAKVPFKVLDAPALQDDFYLNLVDWSSQNVLAVGLGHCVYLWSACTSMVTKLCDLQQAEDVVTSVSWAQRGTHLAVGTNKGEVQVWDTIKEKKVRTMSGHTARVGTLAWSGPTMASGSRDRLIFLRDVREKTAFTHKLNAHRQEVCGLKWSYDEPAFLASGGNDNQLHVVDSRNPTAPVHRFTDHTAAVKAIAWSPHQHGLLASGGGTADRCIRFWNTLSGSALNCVDTGSQVCNLAWSQNCNEIVSTHGYSLNQIVVWRYPSLSKVVTLTGHTYRVLYLAMSPDGSTIVTGAGDETLRFWQVFPGPRSDAKNNAGGLLFPNTLGSVIR